MDLPQDIPIPVPSEPMRIPTFSPAGQPEILRAHQRDQAQLGRLTELTRDVLWSAFGSRQVLPKENLISLVSAVVYFGLTFGSGTQTIGEEYVDIQPRLVVLDRNPSRRRRLFTLFLTILSPPLFRLLLRRLRSQVSRRSAHSEEGQAPQPRTFKEKVLDVMEKLESWVDIASELNLAWFFLRGGFFDLGKRIAGVGYVSSLPPPETPSSDQPTYSILGLLLLFPLLKRLPSLPSLLSSSDTNSTALATEVVPSRFYLPNATLPLLDPSEVDTAASSAPPLAYVAERVDSSKGKESEEVDEEKERQIKEARKCTLCLEEWTDPTVTECGHVFCWSCIVGWSGEKAECPLCRQGLDPSRLLPLYNM